MGLSPAVLHDLLQSGADATDKGKGKAPMPTGVVYELNGDSGQIEPRLRLWVNPAHPPSPPSRVEEVEEDDAEDGPPVALLWALQRHLEAPDAGSQTAVDANEKVEIVIPLVSDSAFFQLLATTLRVLAEHLLAIHLQFVQTLTELTKAVSDSARPVSSTSAGFKAHSPFNSDAGAVRVNASSRKVCCHIGYTHPC